MGNLCWALLTLFLAWMLADAAAAILCPSSFSTKAHTTTAWNSCWHTRRVFFGFDCVLYCVHCTHHITRIMQKHITLHSIIQSERIHLEWTRLTISYSLIFLESWFCQPHCSLLFSSLFSFFCSIQPTPNSNEWIASHRIESKQFKCELNTHKSIVWYAASLPRAVRHSSGLIIY